MDFQKLFFSIFVYLIQEIMFGIGILGILIYAYTIYDVVSSRFAGNNDKLIWVLIVLFLPLLGTVLWFVIGRKGTTR